MTMIKNHLINVKHILEFTSTLKAQRNIKNWNEFISLYLGKKEPKNITFRDNTKLYVRPNDQRTIHEIVLRDDYKIRNMDLVGNIIDIGANIGVFSVMIAKKNVKVYAYEPIESNFKILLKNIKQNKLENKVSAFRLLISDKKGKEDINLDEVNPGCHSIYGTGSKIKLDCISLKDIFLSNKLSQCELLKMDVEGAEYKILYNTEKQIFRKIKNLHLEYHTIENYNGKSLKKFLETKGFKVKIKVSPFSDHGYIYCQR